MSELAYNQTIAKAMRELMEEDSRVVLIGEDIEYGGRFGCTHGLREKFGPQRVKDTPVNEEILVGVGLGAAENGLYPIVELLYQSFFRIAFDDVFRAGTWEEIHHHLISAPLSIRTAFGVGLDKGPELGTAQVAHLLMVPHIQIFAPADVSDAYTLFKENFYAPGLKVFLEHMGLYKTDTSLATSGVTEKTGAKARICRSGNDVTVVSYSNLLRACLRVAADAAEEQALSAEVIDLRRIWPYDRETIIASVRKTKKALLVEEASAESGMMNFIELDLRREFGDSVIVKRLNARAPITPFGPARDAVMVLPGDIAHALASLTPKK
jgi:pyruvate dehydrogenase E1 component beta subunit